MYGELFHPVILVAGIGSIGQRHIRNLNLLGQTNISIYSTGKGTLNKDEFSYLPRYNYLEEALETLSPDIVIIANPTSLHMETAIAAARAGSNLLIEKPVSHNLVGVDELKSLLNTSGKIAMTGFQFRFHIGLKQVKTWLDEKRIGSVINVQAHWGENLQGWHPWEDFRNSYSARSDLGGGVLRTLCHPFDYLRWLLGEVIEISAFTSHKGLELEIEDSADVLMKFECGTIASVHLDYIKAPTRHTLHICGTEGSIFWNNEDGRAGLYTMDKQEWEYSSVPDNYRRNNMFIDEIIQFLDSVRYNTQPECDLEDGIQALRIVLAAEESAKLKKVVTIE